MRFLPHRCHFCFIGVIPAKIRQRTDPPSAETAPTQIFCCHKFFHFSKRVAAGFSLRLRTLSLRAIFVRGEKQIPLIPPLIKGGVGGFYCRGNPLRLPFILGADPPAAGRHGGLPLQKK